MGAWVAASHAGAYARMRKRRRGKCIARAGRRRVTRLSPSESAVGLEPGQVSWLGFVVKVVLPRGFRWS